MDRGIKNSIIFSILILSISVGYYLVFFLPQKESHKLLQEERRIEQEKQDRADCYQQADEKSKESLKKKAELFDSEIYRKASDQGLHLKDDFNSNYENCLSSKGLQK